MTIKPRFRVALLALALASAPVGASLAQSMAGGAAESPLDNLTTLDPYPPEGGWQGLADLLDKLKPGVDTRLKPTASQVTAYIERLLNAGDNEAALALIEKREAEIKGQRGTDVQLMFQHARALAALHRTDEAIGIYTEMTTRFPELPEPWNNLAALYAGRGELQKADDSLRMALVADPNYAAARLNLADLQRRMAQAGDKKAASAGAPGK